MFKKNGFIAVLLIFSSSYTFTSKLHAATGCNGQITYYNGYLLNAKPAENSTNLQFIDQTGKISKQINFSSVNDLFVSGNELFVTTNKDIKRIVGFQVTDSYPTHELANDEFVSGGRPRAFVKKGQIGFVAHGSLGLTVIDLQEKKVIDFFDYRSSVNDLLLDQNSLFVLLNNRSQSGYKGIDVYDLKTLQLKKKSPLTNPAAQAMEFLRDQIVISYFNGMWVYKKKSILKKKRPRRKKIIWGFLGGGSIVGKPYFFDKKVMFCLKQSSDTKLVIKTQEEIGLR